jgi:acetyl esterase
VTLEVRGRLDPQMAEALAKSDALAAEFGPVAPDDIAALRAAYAHERGYWNAVLVELAASEDVTVEAAGLITPLRLYRPYDAVPGTALVYLHGGGFVLGSIETHDRIMRLLARAAGVMVIGVDYALAPETRFPRQLEQIAALIEQLPARFGLDPARIALAGDSAGAHLALATTLGLRDRSSALPAALLLYYGSYGLRDSGSRRLYGGAWDLGEAELAFYRQCYLRGPEDQRDPRYDLLAADLAGTPPCFIAPCALDPLLDDSRALAALLEDQGTPVELRVYDGVLHGFLHLSRMVDLSVRAIEDGARFLRVWLEPLGAPAVPRASAKGCGYA